MAEINLLSATIAHEIDLQRVATGLGSLSNKHLNAISKFVREQLLKTDKITTIKQRDELIKSISAFMDKEFGVFVGDMSNQLNEIIKEELAFQSSTLSTVTGVKAAKPTIKAAVKAIQSVPLVMNGKALSWGDYLKNYTPNQVRAVKDVIIGGWANGLTTREIQQQITGTKTVKGVIQASQRSAYMMAKDLTNHQSSSIKAQIGQANQDVVIGEKVIVTLDSSTSPICQDYGSQDKGGKEFIYSKVGFNFPRPPYHRFCRSTMSFVLAPEYRELEAGRTRPAIINGEAVQVSAETNWIDIAKSNKEFAEVSLGKTKAALLNEMSAKEFTKAAYNRLGDAITLDQMKASNKKVISLLK